MTVSLFDSELYGDLFSDREIVALLDDRARLRAMLEVEAALARVQVRLGMIPAAAAARKRSSPVSVTSDTSRQSAASPSMSASIATSRSCTCSPVAAHVGSTHATSPNWVLLMW